MRVAEVMEQELAAVLGPHTARNAVRTFSLKSVGRAPDALLLEDGPRVVEALRPMLQTLLGHDAAQRVVDDLLARMRP
jgi:hypothetical protein